MLLLFCTSSPRPNEVLISNLDLICCIRILYMFLASSTTYMAKKYQEQESLFVFTPQRNIRETERWRKRVQVVEARKGNGFQVEHIIYIGTITPDLCHGVTSDPMNAENSPERQCYIGSFSSGHLVSCRR